MGARRILAFHNSCSWTDEQDIAERWSDVFLKWAKEDITCLTSIQRNVGFFEDVAWAAMLDNNDGNVLFSLLQARESTSPEFYCGVLAIHGKAEWLGRQAHKRLL